jgi:ankyrin repeat protein
MNTQQITNQRRQRFRDKRKAFRYAEYGMVRKLRLQISTGIDPNITNKFKRTLLYIATSNKKINIVRMLNNEYNVKDTGDTVGLTSLSVACRLGYFVIVQILCKDYNIDQSDHSGMTPLLHAYKNGFYDIARYLIYRNANYFIVSMDGCEIPQDFITEYNRIKNRNECEITVKPEIPVFLINKYIDMSIQLNETCPICLAVLEKDKTIMTACFHLFCEGCHKQIKNCAICRCVF